jgi:pimeloyl-ACP methyl ester carboxylesterase
MRARAFVLVASVVLTACSDRGTAPSPAATPVPSIGRADVGGYELAYACEGDGAPTVVLEAGLGAAGTSQFASFVDWVGELESLLGAMGVEPPVVIAAHSYGGMPARAFAGAYPEDVAGLVLIEASSEPEVPVYERLDAGPWIDGTDRIDIHATVDELRAAGDLDGLPLVVVTAERIEDEWLATVPKLAAGAQARLAGLSSSAIHVVAVGSGHFVYEEEPDVVVAAIRVVVEAARSGSGLAGCEEAFEGLQATCVEPGASPELVAA